jgi:DNA-directed RNA polymerase specialized sigma24 family protein
MSGTVQEGTQRTIERVARESYGRLVAYLSSHTRDVASAEDAFSHALVAALTTWPRDGGPRVSALVIILPFPALGRVGGGPTSMASCLNSHRSFR